MATAEPMIAVSVDYTCLGNLQAERDFFNIGVGFAIVSRFSRSWLDRRRHRREKNDEKSEQLGSCDRLTQQLIRAISLLQSVLSSRRSAPLSRHSRVLLRGDTQTCDHGDTTPAMS